MRTGGYLCKYLFLTISNWSFPPHADSWADSMPTPSPAPAPSPTNPPSQANDAHEYKLYKRRFVGLVGMVRYSAQYPW